MWCAPITVSPGIPSGRGALMRQVVIERPVDPMFLRMTFPGQKIQLRIGEPRPGETRVVILSPGEARRLAYALLLLCEEAVGPEAA